MKVLLLDVNCKNSSTGNIVYSLYTYLNRTGNEAAVCYGRGEAIQEKNIFKFGIDLETYFHALMTRITGYTGCFSFFSTRRLIKFIDRFQPDVVHIHELHAYFINIKPIIKYLKKKHIKTVMTLHCEFAYTGKCGHSLDCEQWKTGCYQCPYLKEYVSTLYFDRTKYMWKEKQVLFSDFDELVVVTPSKWLAARAEQSILSKSRIHVIHNGIDTSCFHLRETKDLRKKLGISENEKIILALAPNLMLDSKGGKYVIELAKKMKEHRFILIGVHGEEQKFIDNMIINGPIYDKNLLAKYYSLADVFVICSEKENFPTTCLEAQCCGTSVVGFDTGGVAETLVTENMLVPYKEVDLLVESISRVLEQKFSKELISQAGCQKYSEEAMCSQYLKIYLSTGEMKREK